MAELLLSVVIPTCNRSDILENTLARLRDQTLDPEKFEVLVLDDGSTDGTYGVILAEAAVVPYRLRAFQHSNRGPGFTQNRGIHESAADVVLILPDDIRASQDLLAQHLKIHARHPDENIAVLGRVVQAADLPPTPIHRYWEPFGYEYAKCEGLQEVPSLCFLACNISFKRRFLLDNGMFRERKGAAAEDIELGYRLGQRGLRILYNQKALGWHYHPVTIESACVRSYETGRNFDLVSDHVPGHVIYPFYRIAWRDAGWRGLLAMLPYTFARASIFNRWSVEHFWLPLLRLPEQNRASRLLARRFSYRGTIGYFFRRGLAERRHGRNSATMVDHES